VISKVGNSDDLRIVRIETFHFKRPLKSEMRISRGGFTLREHAIVRIHTNSGLTGLGEGIGNASQIVSALNNFVGISALDFSVSSSDAWKRHWFQNPTYFEQLGTVAAAVSAVEMAMWDAFAKHLDQPCYRVLGGSGPVSLTAYASDIYWQENTKAIQREASRIASLGYRAIKAHLGVLPPREESRRVRALREALGDDIDLMIDLNCGYNLREAKEAIGRWHEYRLYWLEEPLLPEHNHLISNLMSSANGVPIAIGENTFSAADFAQLAVNQSVDVLMPDVGRVGGISALRDIAAVGQSLGRLVSPHNFSSGILLAATAHVMGSSHNMTLVEVDTSGNAIYDELLDVGWRLGEGKLVVSDAPGLGVVLPEAVIQRDCISSKVIAE